MLHDNKVIQHMSLLYNLPGPSNNVQCTGLLTVANGGELTVPAIMPYFCSAPEICLEASSFTLPFRETIMHDRDICVIFCGNSAFIILNTAYRMFIVYRTTTCLYKKIK